MIEDYYNSLDIQYDTDNLLDQSKTIDNGYNFIYKKVLKHGNKKFKKIDIYTSGGTGSNIRDAETGEYYTFRVGTIYEYLFFKVAFSTGKCNSKNGSNILFYLTPENYEKHLGCVLDEKIKIAWELKKKDIMKKLSVLTYYILN